ncbi:class I SAM-dependent methyltransferase [Candidatus Woesearchaeota archaeon]|nr:MAG: class I SAM-dependent methyltransferase [Candidatus Woesearchaeota archaeon]
MISQQEMSQLIEIKQCNLCGREKFKEVVRGKDRMYLLEGTFKLVKCTNCNLHFVNPRPKDMSKYYPNDYYSFETRHKRNKLAELIYKTYFSKKGSIFLKALFYPIYPLVRTTIVETGKKMLDIGCGGGVFLSRMKNLGLEVHGIDPFAKDNPELNIIKSKLENAPYKKETFDIITINNTLEHVENPDYTIKKISEWLKRGGKTIIGVPNINSLLFKIFGTYWSELDLPRHLYHFNSKTLKRYCAKHGLKIIKIRYNSVPFEITGSLAYLASALSKKPKPLSKSKIASNRALYYLSFPICHILSLLKIGGRLEIIAQKNASNDP